MGNNLFWLSPVYSIKCVVPASVDMDVCSVRQLVGECREARATKFHESTDSSYCSRDSVTRPMSERYTQGVSRNTTYVPTEPPVNINCTGVCL